MRSPAPPSCCDFNHARRVPAWRWAEHAVTLLARERIPAALRKTGRHRNAMPARSASHGCELNDHRSAAQLVIGPLTTRFSMKNSIIRA